MTAAMPASTTPAADMLLEAAAVIEGAGPAAGELFVTCYDGRVTISVPARCGATRARAALVAALGQRAGAAGCRQHDHPGQPSAWLQATGQSGRTVIEVSTQVTVRAAAGGALAAGPGGLRTVIGDGQQLPPGWRWVTDLDDDPPAP